MALAVHCCRAAVIGIFGRKQWLLVRHLLLLLLLILLHNFVLGPHLLMASCQLETRGGASPRLIVIIIGWGAKHWPVHIIFVNDWQ